MKFLVLASCLVLTCSAWGGSTTPYHQIASNLCYEVRYHDENYLKMGYSWGKCPSKYNEVEGKTTSEICDGHSERNIKTCPNSVRKITVYKKGISSSPASSFKMLNMLKKLAKRMGGTNKAMAAQAAPHLKEIVDIVIGRTHTHKTTHQTPHHLTAGNLCYEVNYFDANYAKLGYKAGKCASKYNSVVGRTGSTICDGHSEQNVKTCRGHTRYIVVLKKGIKSADYDGDHHHHKVGGAVDEHGCRKAGGFTWCETTQRCHRIWEEDCPKGWAGNGPQKAVEAEVAPVVKGCKKDNECPSSYCQASGQCHSCGDKCCLTDSDCKTRGGGYCQNDSTKTPPYFCHAAAQEEAVEAESPFIVALRKAAAAAGAKKSKQAAACSHTDESSCDGDKACTWCKSAAVKSSCYDKEQAKQLPPGVFQCGSSGSSLPKSQKKAEPYHLTAGNLCYEVDYHDKAYAKKGYRKGACAAKFNEVEGTTESVICDGDSDRSIKYCPGHTRHIVVLKKGIKSMLVVPEWNPVFDQVEAVAATSWKSCGTKNDRLVAKQVELESGLHAGGKAEVKASGSTMLHSKLQSGAWTVRVYEEGEAHATSTTVGDLMKAITFNADQTTFSLDLKFDLPKPQASGKFTASITGTDQSHAEYFCIEVPFTYGHKGQYQAATTPEGLQVIFPMA